MPEDVYERAKIFEGWVDGINATDGSRRPLPHVERRDLRAADPRRLFAGAADLLPRLQPHRHSGQRAGRGGAGGRQHPLPDRRRRAMRRSSRGEARVRSRIRRRCSSIIKTMRDEGKFLSGRKITTPPRVFLGAAENPFAPPYDFRPLRLAKKIAAGAQFVPDAILLRPAAAEGVHGEGARHRPAGEMLHPGRRRAAGLGQDGALDARQCRRRAYPGRGHQRGWKARRTRRPKARRICVEMIQAIARGARASPACM